MDEKSGAYMKIELEVFGSFYITQLNLENIFWRIFINTYALRFCMNRVYLNPKFFIIYLF